MIVKFIGCDNPGCKTVGRSETEDPRVKKLLPPYGWIRMQGFVMGCGPNIKQIDVCSIDCLRAAVQAQCNDFHEQR